MLWWHVFALRVSFEYLPCDFRNPKNVIVCGHVLDVLDVAFVIVDKWKMVEEETAMEDLAISAFDFDVSVVPLVDANLDKHTLISDVGWK
jgi:hypothetical protein